MKEERGKSLTSSRTDEVSSKGSIGREETPGGREAIFFSSIYTCKNKRTLEEKTTPNVMVKVRKPTFHPVIQERGRARGSIVVQKPTVTNC